MAQKRLKKYAASDFPAHDAASANDVTALRKLLATDLPSPPMLNRDDETPLHSAARDGATDAVDWLLKNTTIDVQCQTKNGETPAHLASSGGHLKALKRLANFDASRRHDVATRPDAQGLNALHLAVVRERAHVVDWLLKEFADSAFARNENGQLPVHFAAASGNLDILKILLKHSGPDAANGRDENGATPVYFAAQEGRLESIQYLVKHAHADPLAAASDGMTSVHAATQGGHLDTVKWLINKLGKDKIQEGVEDGATPVHFAAATGHVNLLEWFLNVSDDALGLVQLTDQFGGTPAHDAAEYSHVECLKLLLRHGADLFATDQEGMSPYSLAIQNQDSEVAQFVMEHAEEDRGDGLPSTDRPSSSVLRVRSPNRGSMRFNSKTTSTTEDPAADTKRFSFPRTLETDAFEINEAQREVQMMLQNAEGPLQPGVALEAAAELTTRRLSLVRAETDDSRKSDSDLDVAFDVENHSPASGEEAMPDTGEGLLRLDSRGMLRQKRSEQVEHFAGPRGDVYASPARLRKRSKPKPNLVDVDGIDEEYGGAAEATRKTSVMSGPFEEVESGEAGGKWYDEHAWYDEGRPPVDDVHSRAAGAIRYTRVEQRPNRGPPPPRPIPYHEYQRGGRNRPPPSRRPAHVVYGTPPSSRRVFVARRRAPPPPSTRFRGPPPPPLQRHQPRTVGPFDNEADIILKPRIVKSHFLAHPRAHPPHSRVAYETRKHQVAVRKTSDNSLTSEYSTTTSPGSTTYRPAPGKRHGGDAVIVKRRARGGGGGVGRGHRVRPVSDFYYQYGHQNGFAGGSSLQPPAAVGRRVAPHENLFPARSMPVIAHRAPERRIKRSGSHDDGTIHRRGGGGGGGVDENEVSALAIGCASAAVVVLAAVAGTRMKRSGFLGSLYGSRRREAASSGIGSKIAAAYETGSALGEIPSESSIVFGGSQSTSNRKGKRKGLGKKTSRSTINSSELHPVPEDEWEYNYETERESTGWAAGEEGEGLGGDGDEIVRSPTGQLSGKDITEAYRTATRATSSFKARANAAQTRLLALDDDDDVAAVDDAVNLSASEARARLVGGGGGGRLANNSHIRTRARPIGEEPVPTIVQSANHRSATGGFSAKLSTLRNPDDGAITWWSSDAVQRRQLAETGGQIAVQAQVHRQMETVERRERIGTVIDLHAAGGGGTAWTTDSSVTATARRTTGSDSFSSLPPPSSQPAAFQYSTVEAAASSRQRNAEAEASLIVSGGDGPPIAPPLQPDALAESIAAAARLPSPPAAKVLEGVGTTLETVNEEEEGMMYVRGGAAGGGESRRRKKTVGEMEAGYLTAATSSILLREELAKKEAELRQVRSMHRQLSLKRGETMEFDGDDDDDDDDSLVAVDARVAEGTRRRQSEAELVRQITMGRTDSGASANLEALERELQELRAFVPARDAEDFLTPVGSDPSSPTTTTAATTKNVRAFTLLKGSEERNRLVDEGLSALSHLPLHAPTALHATAVSSTISEMTAAEAKSHDATDSPVLVRGVSQPLGQPDVDTSYRVGAIGPSVLAEKLKIAKATETRNEALAGEVVSGNRRAKTPVSPLVARSEEGSVGTTLTVPGGGDDDDDDALAQPAQFTPVVARKSAEIVKVPSPLPAESDEEEEEDVYSAPLSSSLAVSTKEAFLVKETTPAPNEDTLVLHDGDDDSPVNKKKGDTSGIRTPHIVRQDSSTLWQAAVKKAQRLQMSKGADTELERKLNRRHNLAAVTEALLTPLLKRKASPIEQEGDGIKI